MEWLAAGNAAQPAPENAGTGSVAQPAVALPVVLPAPTNAGTGSVAQPAVHPAEGYLKAMARAVTLRRRAERSIRFALFDRPLVGS